MRVGFIGLGQMGAPMCDHVVAAGHIVAAYDPVNPAHNLRTNGAHAATSPGDASLDAEVVCIVVRDDAQAIDAIGGTNGVVGAAPDGAIVLLHSTVAPDTVRQLDAACTSAGLRFIDAGISGAYMGAESGTLYVMCGGDRATINEARPVLDCYSAHVVRFGGTGAGMAAKLARNLAQYAATVAVYEGMLLAERSGIDLATFADMCRKTRVLVAIDPQFDKATVAPAVRGADPATEAMRRNYANLARKDLHDALALAREVGVELPLANSAHRTVPASMQIQPGDPEFELT
jgi:3-hydroxyisobutyrate dehydrogenase-like beta-hydroxyacid dehydrogenase